VSFAVSTGLLQIPLSIVAADHNACREENLNTILRYPSGRTTYVKPSLSRSNDVALGDLFALTKSNGI